MSASKRTAGSKGAFKSGMVLVEYRPGKRLRKQIVLGLVLLAIVGICIRLGYWYGINEYRNTLVKWEGLVSESDLLEKRNVQLGEDLAICKHGSELEKLATEQVRQTNVLLQDKVSELGQVVSFYKGIMAPAGGDKGLRIERLDLEATSDPRRYRYKVMLTQIGDNNDFMTGQLDLKVVGFENGKKRKIPIQELSKGFASDGARFRFRYFQDVGGELVLPESFTPDEVEVVAVSEGKKQMRLAHQYDWKRTAAAGKQFP